MAEPNANEQTVDQPALDEAGQVRQQFAPTCYAKAGKLHERLLAEPRSHDYSVPQLRVFLSQDLRSLGVAELDVGHPAEALTHFERRRSGRGFQDVVLLQTDRDLASLGAEPAFRALLARLPVPPGDAPSSKQTAGNSR